jgi:hypothetical protein
MPRHTVGVSVDLPWDSGSRTNEGSLLVSGRYESPRYADTGNMLELAPYFLLTLNQRLGKRLSLSALVRNAVNALYASFAEYPMPGVTATIGMRVLLDDLLPPPRTGAGRGVGNAKVSRYRQAWILWACPAACERVLFRKKWRLNSW